MKTNQLINLFNTLKGTGTKMYYSMLLKQGYDRVHIEKAIKEVGIEKDHCKEEGYSILTF